MSRFPIMSRMMRELPLAFGYFVLAAAALDLTRFENGPAFVWGATALLFARLSLIRPERWGPPLAAAAAASTAASALFGIGFWWGLPLAALNVAEAAAGALLVRRWLGGGTFYNSPGGVAAFVLGAGLAAPAVVAAAGAAIIHAGAGAPFLDGWAAWFAAHGLGTVVFAPIFVLGLHGDLHRFLREAPRWRLTEAVLLVMIVVCVTVAVFIQNGAPLLFVPMLPIMVATLRLGRAGAAVCIVLLAAIGGAFTIHGSGPISLFLTDRGARIQFFQLYLAATSGLILPVAALIRQYRELLLRLSDSEARYRLIAERSADAILSIATDGTILYASPAVMQLAGYLPDDLIGRNIADLVHPEDLPEVREARARAMAAPASTVAVDYRAVTAEMGYRWFETSMRAVVDARGEVTGSVSAIRDITARKATEARLAAAANTDSMTGLPNRRAFALALDARLRAVREDGVRASLAIFDIDWFKSVNDRYGHAAGDAVLIAFAHNARRSLREGDCLARIGGEEFGLVLSVSGPEEAERVCERLRRALAGTPVPVEGGGHVRITVSAGVAPLCGQADAAAVMRAADAALYRAKADGRDRLVLAA